MLEWKYFERMFVAMRTKTLFIQNLFKPERAVSVLKNKVTSRIEECERSNRGFEMFEAQSQCKAPSRLLRFCARYTGVP